MSIRSTYISLNLFVAILCIGTLTSCKEEVTDIGTSFLRDTVFTGSQSFGDLFTMTNRTKQAVDVQSRLFNLNYASPYLFCGTVADESLEAWTILKLPFLHDSLGTIANVDLVLSMPFHFSYGAAAENLEFSVYIESKKVVTEGTTSLTLADLEPNPVGTFQGSIKSDSTATLRVTLDSARIAPLLRTTTLAVVIVPSASMKNIRAFASNENGDNLNNPYIAVKFAKTGPDTTYTLAEPVSYDFHIISDKATDAADQFSIRGAAARRERISINIKDIRSRLNLDPFTIINSGMLQLHLVSRTTSTVPVDTGSPVLVEINTPQTEDSAEFLAAYGARDTKENDVFNFQMRGLIEQALRSNQDSLVMEVRTGFTLPTRTINSESIGVEDYHVNKWIFYGVTATDPLKRPKLSIIYSFLQ